MFSTLWNKLKEILARMIGPRTVENTLNKAPIISSKMTEAIELWGDMYKDKSPWLKEPSYADHQLVASLGLPAFIASEKARMAVLELKSEITAPTEEIESDNLNYVPPVMDEFGNVKVSNEPKTLFEEKPIGPTERAEFMNDCYQNKLLKHLRRQLEYGIAKGSLIIKPYPVAYKVQNIAGVASDDVEGQEEKYTLEFDFIQADGFYPLSFDGSGRLTECAFVQPKVDKNAMYTRLEYHELKNNRLTIINRAFVTENVNQPSALGETDFGKEIPLTSVPEWANLPQKAQIDNVDRLMFGYFKMPDANTIDPYSPLGISGFARAKDLIKQADLQYSRLLWEYEGGELAIDIDRDALNFEKDAQGNTHRTLSHSQQRLYRQVELGIDGTAYEAFAPTLRDASYIEGLNTILMRIEDVCALSRGTLSNVASEAKTATELKILKQRSYSANVEIQQALQLALEDVIYAMNVYVTLYDMVGDCPKDELTGMVNASNIGQYDTSFEWDDSIIVDVETELNKRISLLNMGITSKLELRQWYFGETERQAREALKAISEESEQEMETDLMFSSFGSNTAKSKP